MGYGITSESQLIDIETIGSGVSAYIDALNNLITAAQTLVTSAEECGEKALSINGESMQPALYELAVSMSDDANKYAEAANGVYEQAVAVYNAQVAELNAYYERLAQQQNQS